MLERLWEIRTPDEDAVVHLAHSVGVRPLVARVLANRGVTDAQTAHHWLSPRLADLSDPWQLRDMEAAVEAILDTLDAGERVTIYGDYDVDGMTASSTLARYLRGCGYDPHVFLPDRFRDGYGINADRVRDLVAEGTRLFVSVDCGVSAVEPIALAKELGARFVVIDHHQLPQGALPPADAIVNPHHPDCAFPFDDLCAAGLAFHLCMALRARMRERGHFETRSEPDLRELLDIVAIGTIADVVPLRGLNRILVTAGLKRIPRTRHPGVRALAALVGRRVDAGAVAFQIGPRLNAAGRLAHPMEGFEILATDDPHRAESIATYIDAENQRRREIQREIEEEALAQALKDQGEDANAYVLWSDRWHAGVAGIVAARIVQRLHRPCAVVAVDGGVGKGSIRSIRGFDAVAGLRRCDDTLEQYGGHPHAAGITVRPESLPAFREAFDNAAGELLDEEHKTPRLRLDADVRFRDVDDDLVRELGRLEPFGAGNSEPRLCTRGAAVVHRRAVGSDGAHLKMTLEQDGRRFDAIAFGFGPNPPAPGERVDVAYRPEFNEFRGRVSLQLRVIDLKRPAA